MSDSSNGIQWQKKWGKKSSRNAARKRRKREDATRIMESGLTRSLKQELEATLAAAGIDTLTPEEWSG